MDKGGKDEAMAAKRGDDAMSFQSANVSSDWQMNGSNLTNTPIGMIPNSNPMVDAFCLNVWDQSASSASLGFCDANVHSNVSTSSPFGAGTSGFTALRGGVGVGWHPANTMLKAGMLLPTAPAVVPPNLPQFPADSDFLQRAARFSCFSGGNLGDMMNPFNVPESLSPYCRGLTPTQRPQQVLFVGNGLKPAPAGEISNGAADNGSLLNNDSVNEYAVGSRNSAKEGGGAFGNEPNEPECSSRGGHDVSEGAGGESSGSKKRKRSGQDAETDQNKGTPPPGEAATDQTDNQQKGDQNVTATPSKPGGKQGSQASDNPKEDYIHIRARRGQATNSHSLAERVRREKISERMKFLQDLVPGCNKVTGKAVMLDEIINYVQSLQRQVEFLSMKLATVNPRLEFNIDGLLAKDILQSRAGPSSSLSSFPHDMTMVYPPVHHPPSTLIQAGLPSLGNSADALRRTINSHLATVGGSFKEPTPQVPSMWDDELHNVVQMGFNPSAPLDSQDIGSLPPGHMKSEP